ncbi:MAG: HAD family hydrolase [Candidatus Omnitrophica bacterium]|nr:HAD family hydrolase [Candidatus Omnitrophota bacterium]
MEKIGVVFLDRDGVINKYPGDKEYVKSWEEFHFLYGIKSALKELQKNGFKIFIISNQAGVAKRIYSEKALNKITENMLNELRKNRIKIDGVYYCIHQEKDNCLCRKPKTGLLDKAISKLNSEGYCLDPLKSYFIGDTIRDIQTGKARGLKTILVFSGKEKPEDKATWQVLPDYTALNLSEAVKIILNKI